ncbi:hypothetical protein ACHHYP_03404 [Achlya hypogyna]|uniref:Uncharacterized protein n=1 Tax=Achlya hypogyna TaxID=1202772 RepID=A0A1V9ZR98_ACHHY|nr:hypothetical protein ACHHYP_03404 [Achlya hypogyna]
MSHSGHGGDWGHFIALTPTKESFLEQRDELKGRLLARSPLPSPVLRPLRLSRKTGCLYNLCALDDHLPTLPKQPKLSTLHAVVYPSALCPRSEPREVQPVPPPAPPANVQKTAILALPPAHWWSMAQEVRVVLAHGRVEWVPVTPTFEPIAAASVQSWHLRGASVCRIPRGVQLTSEHGETLIFRCPSLAASKAWLTALSRAIAEQERIALAPSAPIRIHASMRSQ